MVPVVICFDLDGTLLDEHNAIHPMDLALLSHPPANTWLIPASGRSLDGVRGMFRRHGLFPDRPVPFPVITQNGAACYSPGEQLEYYQAFLPKAQEQLLDLAGRYPDVTTFISTHERMSALHLNSFGLAGAERFSFIIQPDPYEITKLALCKLMYFSDQHERLLQIASESGEITAEKAFSMVSIFEVTPQGSNKGSGLKNLLAAMQLEKATVLAAGDGGNDLPLFALADCSFAPVASPPIVRDQANRLINPAERGLLTPMLEELNLIQ